MRLAEESGVSVRSLSAYENDSSAEPSEETRQKLAAALGVLPRYLTRDAVDFISAEAASFRKLSRTSATKRDAALASAHLALELFDLIGARFNLPVPQLPTLDKLQPDQAAELTRRRWGLGDRPISNMVQLLESKGVRVLALTRQVHEIDAFCVVRDHAPYVFLNTGKSGERQRFDAAHELGHLVLHEDRAAGDSRQREAEANHFAAAFLMPRSAIATQAMAGASVGRILAARRFWAVSAMAMTHRLHELGLLTDWQYRSTCMQLSDQGYRSAEPDGIVPETSQLLRKVLFGVDRLNLAEAADELAVDYRDLTAMLSGLVPVAA